MTTFALVGKTRRVQVAACFTPGEPLDRRCNDAVDLPVDLADDGDELYRVGGGGMPSHNISSDDILIIEPRPRHNASTAELVLVELAGRAYLGRWWTKRRRRVLLDEDRVPIVEGREMRVLGAVTLVVRVGPR